MVATVFDSLVYAKKLQGAGVSVEAAEVHAMALSELVYDRLATKEDIKDLKLELETEIKNLRTETKHEMHILEERLTHTLTIRLGSMMAAGIILLETLHKVLG